jgi:hypothetical protein
MQHEWLYSTQMTLKYYIIRDNTQRILALHKTKDSAVALFLQMSVDSTLEYPIMELITLDADDYGKASEPILLYSYTRHFNSLISHIDD